MTDERKPETPGLVEVLAKFTPEAEAAAKKALAKKTIPQDTLLPLLDAPLDELAAYLADHTWEARKDYLDNMMGDSLNSLFKQIEIFERKGLSKSKSMYVTDGCLVGLHIKIGQLLDAWGATKPADKHAAALFVLSASSEHRHALSEWMPGGTTSPPEENQLFEPGEGLMIFKNISLALRPGLSECWRQDQEGCNCGDAETGPEADLERLAGRAGS